MLLYPLVAYLRKMKYCFHSFNFATDFMLTLLGYCYFLSSTISVGRKCRDLILKRTKQKHCVENVIFNHLDVANSNTIAVVLV